MRFCFQFSVPRPVSFTLGRTHTVPSPILTVQIDTLRGRILKPYLYREVPYSASGSPLAADDQHIPHQEACSQMMTSIFRIRKPARK